MNKLRSIVVSAFISCFSAFIANAAVGKEIVYDEGVITLNNGETIKCEIDNSTYFNNQVLYRVSPKDTLAWVNSKDIHTMMVMDAEGHYYALENINYVYDKEYLKGTVKKMNVSMYNVVEYGAMNLYSHMVKVYQNGVWTHDIYHYVCRKKSDDYGVYVGFIRDVHQGIMSKKTKKEAESKLDKLYENLFGDCPELCKMIREKKLTFLNIEDIVREYNLYRVEMDKDKK